MKILWISSTRYCDWYKIKRRVPVNIMNILFESSVLGEKQWIRMGVNNDKNIAYEKGMLKASLDHIMKNEKTYLLSLGGDKPREWEAHLGMFPYVSKMNQVRGINSLQIRFEWLLEDEKLIEIFKKVNQGNLTEFAFIHPYEQWDSLTDGLFGDYGNPVTFKPGFSGVFWAIYLGPGHLQLFDKEKLNKIKAYKTEWLDEDAYFLQVCSNISDTEKPEIQKQMLSLTQQFREALL